MAAFGAMGVLALATGAYAYLLGPLLGYLFGVGMGVGGQGGFLVWVAQAFGWERAQWTQALPWIIAGVAAAKGFAFYGQAALMGEVREGVCARLRTDMSNRLLEADPEALQDRVRGDLAARFGEDVEVVAGGAVEWVTAWVRDGGAVAVLVGLAVWLDGWLALWALVVWPLALIPLVKLGRRLRGATHRGQQEQGALQGVVVAALDARSLLRTEAEIAAARARFEGVIHDMASARLAALRAKALSHPLMEFLGVGGLAATLWYATGRIEEGSLAPEVFVSFFAALLMLYEPIKGLTRAYAQRQAALAGLDRLGALLSLPLAPKGLADAQPLRSALALRGVWVAYQGLVILKGVDLTIPAGSVAVLTGPSGAGKSSLLRILARMQRPQGGRVLWDGADVEGFGRARFASHIGYLDQGAPLFGRTIREHLDPAHKTPDDALWCALRAANLEGELRERPENLDAPLYDGAQNLSGGQRRRLALARALLSGASVLLLDEPTDAVDAASEAKLLSALCALKGQRTLVIVTHDPQLIPWADACWEVRDGHTASKATDVAGANGASALTIGHL